MAREFIMKMPNEKTKQRMREVIFWLIIKQLKQNNSKALYIDNVIENLALLFDCKVTNINYAIANLEYMLNKPTLLELGLANKYADVQIRTVCQISKVANKTMYNALENYVLEDSPDLIPKLSDNINLDIAKFIKGMHKTFGNISHLLKVTRKDPYTKKIIPGIIYD